MYTEAERILVSQLRDLFRDLNKRQGNNRYKQSKPVEGWILEALNKGTPFQGVNLLEWQKSSEKDDVEKKEDGYTYLDGKRITIQIKFRQPSKNGSGGSDLGVALFEPFDISCVNLQKLWHQESKNLPWARDMQFDGELFSELAGTGWDTLHIVNFKSFLKPLAMNVLDEWMSDTPPVDITYGSPFCSKKFPGCEIHFTKDANKGTRKAILYVKPKLIADQGVSVDMIPPSPSALALFFSGTLS